METKYFPTIPPIPSNKAKNQKFDLGADGFMMINV